MNDLEGKVLSINMVDGRQFDGNVLQVVDHMIRLQKTDVGHKIIWINTMQTTTMLELDDEQ